MEKTVSKIQTMRMNFEKIVANMKAAQEDLENEIRKKSEQQVRDAIGEPIASEVPEGLVATEIKCNNGDLITGLPAPT
jgi:hypothetical protein